MYILFLLLPPPALAYNYLDYNSPPFWKSGGVIYTIRTVSFPESSSQHAALVRAVEEWDQGTIPGSSFGTDFGNSSSTDNVHFNDGVNDVVLTDVDRPGECNLALVVYRGKQEPTTRYIKEAELLLDVDCTWSGAINWYDIHDPYYEADQYNLEQVAIHEMGHVAGLDHEHGIYDQYFIFHDRPGKKNDTRERIVEDYEGWPVTMETTVGGGSVIGDLGFLERQYMVNEDDRQGLRGLYPATDNDGVDIAVQSYHTPDDDTLAAAGNGCQGDLAERSRPDPRTDFLAQGVAAGQDYGDCPPNPVADSPQTVYPIFQGAHMDVTFSLLNLGNQTTSVDWEIVLYSTASNARSLQRRTSTLGANQPFEVTSTVTIPTDMAPGYYWIAARMDPDQTLAEVNEGNNQAIWNQYVEVVPLSACGCSSGGAGSTSALLAGLGAIALRRRGRR